MSPETVVSISDFVLAAFSGALAVRLLSRPTEMTRTRNWLGIVLGGIAVSSVLGGISHGLVPEETGQLGELIWRATLMAIGPAAIGLWMLGSMLLFRPSNVERIRAVAVIALAIYTGVVLFEYQHYWVALAMYLPAAVLLLVAFMINLRGQQQPFAADGAIAMVITLGAGLLQYLRVGIHPVFFNHNAVYHLFQGIAVYFLYRAGDKWLTLRPRYSLKAEPLIAKIG